MTELGTASTEALTTTTTSTSGVLILTKKNVAVAIVVAVVTVGLGYVLYKVIADYRAKKQIKKTVDAATKPVEPVAAAA